LTDLDSPTAAGRTPSPWSPEHYSPDHRTTVWTCLSRGTFAKLRGNLANPFIYKPFERSLDLAFYMLLQVEYAQCKESSSIYWVERLSNRLTRLEDHSLARW